jgi:hypothetical protein
MTAGHAPHSPPMETMRIPMSMMWFVILGAVGFGIGGALGFWSPWGILLSGALGGASLGLAFKDVWRVVSLAVLGLVGLAVGLVGLLSGLIAGIPVWLGLLDPSSDEETMVFGVSLLVLVGVAILGAMIGAAMGANFGDWRRPVQLAVAGAVGFGVGSLLSDLLTSVVPILGQLGEGGGLAFASTLIGVIGGASLGAALGYLEHRKLAQSADQG